jgi:cell division protein FtsW
MEIFRPRSFDKILFLATCALLVIGIIMVFSSSGILASQKYHQPFYFLINQVIGAALGIGLVFFILQIRRPFYKNPTFVYGLLLLTLILLVSCFVMPTHAKTNRWIEFFGFRFQPSELAKISLVLFFSLYLDRKKDKLHELRTFIFPSIILFLFILLILKEPDYGTAFLVFFISAILLFLGGAKLRHLSYLGLSSLVIFAFYLFQASYRLDRIFAYLSPEKDPTGKSFQIIQSKLAVGSGGLFGVSIGESVQKLFFLPCAHTDYIFAILGEELGLIGTLATLFLFVIFLWRGLLISIKASNLSSQIAAAGITLAIFSQALLNITIVSGLGPPTGVPLPLLSFGRSSLITNLFAIGILLNISQRKGNNGRKT